jgi:hypothetical protein
MESAKISKGRVMMQTLPMRLFLLNPVAPSPPLVFGATSSYRAGARESACWGEWGYRPEHLQCTQQDQRHFAYRFQSNCK